MYASDWPLRRSALPPDHGLLAHALHDEATSRDTGDRSAHSRAAPGTWNPHGTSMKGLDSLDFESGPLNRFLGPVDEQRIGALSEIFEARSQLGDAGIRISGYQNGRPWDLLGRCTLGTCKRPSQRPLQRGPAECPTSPPPAGEPDPHAGTSPPPPSPPPPCRRPPPPANEKPAASRSPGGQPAPGRLGLFQRHGTRMAWGP